MLGHADADLFPPLTSRPADSHGQCCTFLWIYTFLLPCYSKTSCFLFSLVSVLIGSSLHCDIVLYALISRETRFRVMMARQNPRTGTKIEKRTRTRIVAGTVTETEGETGIGIGTRIETETEIEIGIGIAKVGITVKEGNRETVRMITEAVILKGMPVVFAAPPL